MNHVYIIKTFYLINKIQTDKVFFSGVKAKPNVCVCASCSYLSHRHLNITRDEPVWTGIHNCVLPQSGFFFFFHL